MGYSGNAMEVDEGSAFLLFEGIMPATSGPMNVGRRGVV